MVRSKSASASAAKRGKAGLSKKEDDRRRAIMRKRTVWPEKGIDLEELQGTFVPSVVTAFGWERVARQVLPYNEDIVREFYAMLAEEEFRHSGRVVVQGVEVVITAERINAFYGLPDMRWAGGIPPQLGKDCSIRALAKELRKSGRGGWDAKEDPVKHKDLNLEAAFWNKFASHSIKPARHIYTVPLKKMLLVVSLLQRRQIDLGKVIFLEMEEASAVHEEGTPVLPFPGLISHFCQDAGIDVFAEQRQVCPASHPIDASSFNRLLKNHPELPKLPTRKRREQMQAEESDAAEEFAEEGQPEVEPQQPENPPQNDAIAELMRAVLAGQVRLGEQLSDVQNTQTELKSSISALQAQVVENQTETNNHVTNILATSDTIMQRLSDIEDAVHYTSANQGQTLRRNSARRQTQQRRQV